MSVYIKGMNKPSNCLECPFLSKFLEISIRNIDEYPHAYEKIAHCMLCPEEIEDPWRNTEWLLEHTESWCPIEQKDGGTND